MDPSYFPRSAWGALPATRSTMTSIEGIIVHHTTGTTLGADYSDDWVRNIDHQHHNQGWNGGIGYSFLFDSFGQIFEGRGWGVVGAHTIGLNSTHHAFAFLGDGGQNIPRPALDALHWLIQESDRRYGIKPISGHRDHYSTECCGDRLYALKDQRGEGPVMPPLVPPAEPSTPPRPAYPLWPGVFLRLGSRGAHVKTFQQRLHDRGWKLGVDGAFGNETDRVTRQFQGEKHLLVDGVVGRQTWNTAWEAPVT